MPWDNTDKIQEENKVNHFLIKFFNYLTDYHFSKGFKSSYLKFVKLGDSD